MNKGNIQADQVAVYLARFNTDPANLAAWLSLGWCEGGKTRFFQQEIYIKKMNDFRLRLGRKYQFDTIALQTPYSQLTGLEALVAEPVDILLISQWNPLRKYLLQYLNLEIEPEFVYSLGDPRRLRVMARRQARNLSGVGGGGVVQTIDILAHEDWGIAV